MLNICYLYYCSDRKSFASTICVQRAFIIMTPIIFTIHCRLWNHLYNVLSGVLNPTISYYLFTTHGHIVCNDWLMILCSIIQQHSGWWTVSNNRHMMWCLACCRVRYLEWCVWELSMVHVCPQCTHPLPSMSSPYPLSLSFFCLPSFSFGLILSIIYFWVVRIVVSSGV